MSLGGQRDEKVKLAFHRAVLKKADLRGAAYDFLVVWAKSGPIIGFTSRLWSARNFLLKFEMAVRKWPPAEDQHGRDMRLFFLVFGNGAKNRPIGRFLAREKPFFLIFVRAVTA